MNATILTGDVIEQLRTLPDASVQCCVTSPPYWGLRDYGTEGQIGLERTPQEYVAKMVAVFGEVRRVLREDGVCWLNLGDSYNGSGGAGGDYNAGGLKAGQPRYGGRNVNSLKPKDLVGIPWRVAFALQEDGWWLRSDIIWCLSGGTWLYARTQKGDMPIMVRDLARLRPETVKLWNGEKWTQLLGMNRNHRCGDEIELVLRSGERISCTPTHRFPTERGLLEASEIVVGDKLQACRLPQPEEPRDCALDEDAAWIAGLYLAEGSRSEDTIQIAGHTKETARWKRCERIARKFGGSATLTVDGNRQSIRLYGKVLNAVIDELVSGKTAKDKCFAPVVWRYSDSFITAMLDGYLSGDGHHDAANDRWRLGFTRNYNLERDLRTACARLGYKLKLSFSTVAYNGKQVPTFRGEIRKTRSGHHNERCMTEVMEIRKARCREVYDLGVADAPHLFALASGVLTHNSKPNPMPESVTDRPTKSHEYVFLLTKSARYFYDSEAIKEAATPGMTGGRQYAVANGLEAARCKAEDGSAQDGSTIDKWQDNGKRNARTVWNIATQPYPEAHFATFPEELPRRCILAGTSSHGCCPVCGAPWERVVERNDVDQKANEVVKHNGVPGLTPGTSHDRVRSLSGATYQHVRGATIGWRPTCAHDATPVPCTVLDPFAGSGTTLAVALQLGRHAIGIELNPAYVELAQRRIAGVTPALFGV